ncbi:MAG: prolyl oligopeptidase family serine peptidase [Phycisphaerales bacterium]|nr:MAG: prolyl oligopeptidase family serine peptidase [Phycisphaerales bacterium]
MTERQTLSRSASEMRWEVGANISRRSEPVKSFALSLACATVLLSSCAHYRCDPDYGGPTPRNQELLAYYDYPKENVEARVERIAERRRYFIERVEFPSTKTIFGTEDIKLDYYVQKKEGKFPTVLVLPIAGGVDFSVTSFAGYFAARGFNCCIVHNREVNLDKVRSVEELEGYFRQSVLDNRQVLDYLVRRDKVDANRLGCMGMSLGGIKTAMISAVDERIKYCVMGLAGGSIADIAVSSRERAIRDSIKAVVAEGISLEDAHAEMSEKIRTDPIKLAEYIDARNALMFIAAFDRVVPRQTGEKLWKAVGKPEVIRLFSGHYTSFLYLPCAQAESLKFFRRKFRGG